MIENWSWASYKEWIASTLKQGVPYYFRGQLQPSWKLQTSFHRYAAKSDITLLDYLDRIIPEVNYYVSATLNEHIDITNQYQFGSLLAKLQHHGFPTPLLDWTLSPYIAAYFAYRDIDPLKPQTNKVCIYVLDINLWTNTFVQELNLRDDKQFVSVVRPIAKNNQRLIRQMAVTTASNVNDIEEYMLRRGAELEKTFLYKIELPVFERKLVMNDLNLMGINSMTMFPDFDGICSSMKELFFNNIEVILPAPPPPAPQAITTPIGA